MNIHAISRSPDTPSRRIGPNWAYIVSVREGTTAGGTEVIVFSDAARGGATFTSATKAWFDPDNCNTTTKACASYCTTSDVEDADEIDAEAVEFINAQTLKITTRRFFESGDSIILDVGGDGVDCAADDVLLSNYADGYPAYQYKTLAYTANQGAGGPGSQSVSIVDTATNGTFAPQGSMDVTDTVIPMNMAYNLGDKPGRRLLSVDYHSGNLEYYDAANFKKQGTVTLQDPTAPTVSPRAFDLALSRGGQYAFVTHITKGFADPWDPTSNPKPGDVSVVENAGEETPLLYDVDQDPNTTTMGAPMGITRIGIPMREYPPSWHFFYPLSIEAVMITDAMLRYQYRDGEPWPGEYMFLSGVGETRWVTPPCMPGQPCRPVLEPRPAMVAVIDGNRILYCDPIVHPPGYCDDPTIHFPGGAYYNTRHWQAMKAAYAVMGDGVDGINLGETSYGLGFSLTSGMPPSGSPALGPTVYMLNEMENKAYLFNYSQATGDWNVVMDPANPLEAFTIATGSTPTDVKVQKVTTEFGPKDYAYITNAGDDTVRIIDTANNSSTGDYSLKPPVYSGTLNPTSYDTRSSGDKGFSANFMDNTVTALRLSDNQVLQMIGVGEAPIRIVVQPVPGYETFFGMVRNELAFAQPTDFTTPSKQSNLIRDWEDVHQLQGTSADSQAVLANIAAFQTKVGNWVVNAALNKELNEGINIYRSAYIHDHPGQ